jgi:multiple sugar transport system substrate-binding protein
MASSTSAFTRRSFLGLGVGAAAVTALAACSGGASTSASTSGGASKAPGNATSGTVTWWASPISTSGPDARTALIAEFEKAYPNIKINMVSAPSDTDTNRATLTTQISGGGGPDVYMGDVIWPAQFGAHELAVPLSKYLPESYFGTFAKGLVAGATYKSEVYAAPFFTDSGFLYYRKDLLEKYNLSVPTTWDALMDASKKVQAGGDVPYGYVFQGADYEGATCDFMEFLTDAGGTVLNSAGTKSTLNSAAAIKALTFEQSLVTSGVAPKAMSTYQETQSMNDFANGKSLFMRNWSYAYGASQAAGTAVVGKVGVAPMPGFSGPGYSNVGGWNLYINPHSKNVAADLTFVKWMTGNDAQGVLKNKFSMIPTNQKVRETGSSNPVLQVVPKTKLVSRPSNTPNYPAVSQAIYDAVNGVIAGSLQPAAAVKQASDNVTKAISATGGL